MAGWRGAIAGAIFGLLVGPQIAGYSPQAIAATLGPNGLRFLIALAGAWLGALLSDVGGVVRARRNRAS
ncbi:MAG: hypothetical protein ABR552_04310 [Actinomycetota bacterium]